MAINSISLSLFGGASSSTTTTPTGLDASMITAWAKARAGVTDATAPAAGADPNAPTPPWTPGYTPAADALVQSALTGKAFFDPKAAIYADKSMGEDYRQLFALYQGVSTLSALADRASDKTLPAALLASTSAQFTRGLSEFQTYLNGADFKGLQVAAGDRVDEGDSKLGLAVPNGDYQTGVLVSGSVTGTIPGLANNAQFTVNVRTLGGTQKSVLIDLSQMGSLPRSLGSIKNFVNQRLAAAGVATRFDAVNTAPKTQQVKVGATTVTRAYTGPGQWALKVDVATGETVSFASTQAQPAFYVAGQTSKGGSLVKLEDTSGAAGQPVWLMRPPATDSPIGPDIATGFLGAGAPAEALETRTSTLVGDGDTAVEKLMKSAGEATLKLTLEDGRTVSVTTGWRSSDLEKWRTQSGATDDQAMLGDLAQRLTQLLHEQGVSAGVDTWTDANDGGLSIFTADGVSASALTIGGRTISLSAGRAPTGDTVGGLRAGVFARRFEAATTNAPGALFTGVQSFVFATPGGSKAVLVDGGEDGISADDVIAQVNAKLAAQGVPAAASFVDVAGKLTLRADSTHGVTGVDATLNTAKVSATLLAPGAWATGGLPNAASGEPFGDLRRTYTNAGASPLVANTGALDIAITVATATGDKVVNVAVSGAERALDPDPSSGHWSAAFQQRVNDALNAAGIYAASNGDDLGSFTFAEGSGQRLKSVSVNGQAVTYSADAPSFGLGGAFDAQRSFTTASAATGVSDPSSALQSDPSVSVTFDTAWGTKTISASLQSGDPRTLEAAAQRLNEALAAAGYDVGVAATPLSGGGAGLRVVAGSSGTVMGVDSVSIGGQAVSATLDPVDALTHASDPVGLPAVAQRTARDAAIVTTTPFTGTSPYQAPNGSANWFAGRDFDLTIGQGAKVLATRATATGADGSVYVVADVSGAMGDQPVSANTSDVALLKYDSAGKLLYSRTLGAADQAQGFALAVSADGKIAVGGAVKGDLSGAAAAAGGTDSFVAMFDASGHELWTQRRGASADDTVKSLAFTSSGVLIASGETKSALQTQVSLGGQDAYVRGYSASGTVLFTKQYGTSGTDSAGALLVHDAGGGAVDIYLGGVESGRGIVRSFSYSAASGLAAGASRDLGDFRDGGVTSLAYDNGALYVGGAVGADRLAVANTANPSAAGTEGFVARIDDDLVSTGADRVSYLGSAQADSVTGVTIADGHVYALGQTGGVIAGQGAANKTSAFVARLDDSGGVDWLRTFAAGAGGLTPTSLAVDATGASPLDQLGLPRGTLSAADSSLLVDRSALRANDQFSIRVGNGAARRITIAANETLSSLARKIDSTLHGGGRATVVTQNGVQRLQITVASGHAIFLDPGPTGHDALPGIGLGEGVIAAKTVAKGDTPAFGLGLIASDLSIATPDAAVRAKTELTAALSIIRQAYEALANPNGAADKAANPGKTGGTVPDYLTKQIANYQTALTRLTGSTGS